MTLGSHATAEQRAKNSAVHKGQIPYVRTPETRAKQSMALKGRTVSDEWRAKLSASHMGNRSALGHHCSDEVKTYWSSKRKGQNWKGGPKASRRRTEAKRRDLGYVYLNEMFPGCEGHHIDKEQVINMPHKLHRSVYHRQSDGRGMAAINAVAFNFLFKQEVEAALKATA